MFASFKVIRDGETTYHKAQPIRQGLMASIMREAHRGSPRSLDVQTRVSSRGDDDAIRDDQTGKWLPLW